MTVYFKVFIIQQVLLFFKFTNGDVIVQDVGTFPVENGDMGLIFYVTLSNKHKCKYHVTTEMIKCYEIIDNEQDYKTINLIGGDMGVMDSLSTLNATLIFPNLYLRNRFGSCAVLVKYCAIKCKNAVNTIQVDINFNTSISQLPCSKYCCSPDLDPEFNCAPVDCMIKYSGFRSYFNYDVLRCQAVPQCIADINKIMPDVSYVPLSNRCKDLTKPVTKLDLQILENDFKDCGREFIYTSFVCHNGVVDNTTKQCVCFDGWTSSLDCDYRPSLGLYHLCNIEVGGWVNINRSKINMTFFLISILAVTIASKLLFAMCILHMCYNWAKKKDDGSEAKPSPSYEEKQRDEGRKQSILVGDVLYDSTPFKSKKSLRSRTSSSGDIKISIEQTSETNSSNYTHASESEMSEQSSSGDEDEEIVLEYTTDLSETKPAEAVDSKSRKSSQLSESSTPLSKQTTESDNVLTSFNTTSYGTSDSTSRKSKEKLKRANVKFDVVVSGVEDNLGEYEISQETTQ